MGARDSAGLRRPSRDPPVRARCCGVARYSRDQHSSNLLADLHVLSWSLDHPFVFRPGGGKRNRDARCDDGPAGRGAGRAHRRAQLSGAAVSRRGGLSPGVSRRLVGGISIAITPLSLLIQAGGERTERIAASLGLLIAAMWQMSPTKALALRRCSRTAPLRQDGWRADLACARYGADAARDCINCMLGADAVTAHRAERTCLHGVGSVDCGHRALQAAPGFSRDGLRTYHLVGRHLAHLTIRSTPRPPSRTCRKSSAINQETSTLCASVCQRWTLLVPLL